MHLYARENFIHLMELGVTATSLIQISHPPRCGIKQKKTAVHSKMSVLCHCPKVKSSAVHL